MYRKILVPTDGSRGTLHVIEPRQVLAPQPAGAILDLAESEGCDLPALVVH